MKPNDKPETFNCHVPSYLLELVEKQREVFPLLKTSDILTNILKLYYKPCSRADWLPNDINSIHEEEEPKKGKKRSFK